MEQIPVKMQPEYSEVMPKTAVAPPVTDNKFIQKMTTPSNSFIARLTKTSSSTPLSTSHSNQFIKTANAQEEAPDYKKREPGFLERIIPGTTTYFGRMGDNRADAGFEANKNLRQTRVLNTKNGSIRTVPEDYKSTIVESATKYGISPKLLSAVINQESSMGTNPANFNDSIGKSAWLVGMTRIALDELKRRGINASAETPQEAIDAAAAYISLAKDKYKNPVTLYEKWYKTGKPLSEKNRRQFIESINEY